MAKMTMMVDREKINTTSSSSKKSPISTIMRQLPRKLKKVMVRKTMGSPTTTVQRKKRSKNKSSYRPQTAAATAEVRNIASTLSMRLTLRRVNLTKAKSPR